MTTRLPVPAGVVVVVGPVVDVPSLATDVVVVDVLAEDAPRAGEPPPQAASPAPTITQTATDRTRTGRAYRRRDAARWSAAAAYADADLSCPPAAAAIAAETDDDRSLAEIESMCEPAAQ